MFTDNKTTFIKREIMSLVAKSFFNKTFNEINRIPLQIISRKSTPNRCCIEKDRNLVKQRAIAIMGFDVTDEDKIDNSLLSDYAEDALNRETPCRPILTFIDEACKSCVRVNYYVTEVCRNCVAKPCIMNCPKNAINIKNNQASIDKEKCINCGICQKACPFHAIVFVPVPCEESCPVGAIKKDENGKQFIDYNKCIYCGKCIKSCPFGAVAEKSQIVDVIKQLQSSKPTVIMIAPAIAGQFPGKVTQLVNALKKVGFTYVVEVAKGADITASNEALEFEEKMNNGEILMGTSCCPSYIEAVKKHAPDFEKYVSHTKTPMIYTAMLAKKEFPDASIIFTGPCIAKKHEGFISDIVDFVLTFEELAALLIAKEIDVIACDDNSFDLESGSADGRGFSVSGGVSNAVINKNNNEKTKIIPVIINGLDKKNINLLKAYGKGKAPGNLIEVMSCEGGCISGPGSIGNRKICHEKVEEYKLL